MACCSRRRAASVATPFHAAPTKTQPQSSPQPRQAAGVLLVYTGTSAMALRGPASGQVYRLQPRSRPLEADLRDVDALLRCGLFARAAPAAA